MDKKRILIAEDDMGIQTSLYFILKDRGYSVQRTSDGAEALEALRHAEAAEEPFDLLVTDIQMPKMTGLGLIESMSSEKIEVPVVVITGYGDKDTLVKLLRLGCDDFLDKPFKPGDVRAKVSEVLAKREAERQEQTRKHEGLIEENLELVQQVESYEETLDRIKAEVDSAVGSYRNLIDVSDSGYRVEFAFRTQPLRDLGGDYVDIRNTATGCDVIVADVAGHDMSASYHTVLIKAFFDENMRTGNDGEELFRLLNHSILESGKNERMVTALFMRIDLQAQTATIVSAGHPKVIRLRRGEDYAEPVHTRGSVLGLSEEVIFESADVDIRPGDRFFLYTDGIVNAYYIDGPTGVRHTLGEQGLEGLLSRSGDLPLRQQVDTAWEEVMRFCRQKQTDDMLLAAVQIPLPDAG